VIREFTKADPSIEEMDAGRHTERRDGQPENMPEVTVTTRDGEVKERLEMELPESQLLHRRSALDGTVNERSVEQPEKTAASMQLRRDIGVVATDSRALQLAKQWAPRTKTVSGSRMLRSDEQA
jgi:hypothetical protein